MQYVNCFQTRCYHPLKTPSDKHVALEFNLDVRRYSNSIFNKQPQFYTKLNNIILQYDTFIVCKVFNMSVFSTVFEPTYESEYVPEYVVKISKVSEASL